MNDNEQFSKAIGIELKKLRTSNHYSQQNLADRLGVSKMAISYWERGKHDIYAYQVRKICHIFNVKESDFYAAVEKQIKSA